MPATPDRHPGPLIETEEIILGGDEVTDPTALGALRYVGGVFRLKDGVEVFDPRVLSSDARHGNRGGGSLHAVGTSSVAGFMSAADKTKLDALSPTFGEDLNYVEADAETSTTSASWQTKLTLTTTSLQAGSYYVLSSVESRVDAANKEYELRFLVDTAETSLFQRRESLASVIIGNVTVKVIALAAGVHTAEIQFRRIDSGITLYVRRARIAFWRVA